MLSFALHAAEDRAERILDEAVAKLKADSGVQMEFEYSIFDADTELQFSDKGTLFIDSDKIVKGKECFALLMEQLKIWCNGSVQWNYSGQTNEIYITGANSEEAHNLSPLYIMQLYKSGYSCSLVEDTKYNVITLQPADSNGEFDKVVVTLDKKSLNPVKIVLLMNGNGSIEIVINNYKAGCKFSREQFTCPVKEFPEVEIVDMR